MPTYEQLMGAARRADAAGDEYAARRFLTLAKEARDGSGAAPAVAPSPEAQGLPTAPVEAPAPPPQTGVLGQVGTGMNEGIADMLGAPVDMATAGLNWLGGKVGMDPIQSPVGGSQSLRGLLSPFMTAEEPQTAGQRIARRVGQEVGAGAVAAPVAGIGSAGSLALNTAANAASGAAGGATAEVTDDPYAQIAASILAGAGTVGAAHRLRPGPTAPSLDALKAERAEAYARVRGSEGQITPEAMSRLNLGVQRQTSMAEMDDILHPKASRAVERLRDTEGPTISKLEQRRQYIGSDVAGSVDAGERRLGSILKDEIDGFLGKLGPADLRGEANPDEIVAALQRGRAAHSKVARSEMLEAAIDRAERRAATSGTGGNVVNTTRQNIRSILDDPRKARKFSQAERDIMEAIVRGTGTTNTMRMLGRLSPSSGALPYMASGIGGVTGAASSGNPLFMLPATVGYAAKEAGERLTAKQVKKLQEVVRNGGPVAAKTLTDGERRVLQAMMAVQGVSASDQGQ